MKGCSLLIIGFTMSVGLRLDLCIGRICENQKTYINMTWYQGHAIESTRTAYSDAAASYTASYRSEDCGKSVAPK